MDLREEIAFKILQIKDKDVIGDVTDEILKLIEKRIDYVEQRAIEYITCKDEGDPKTTRELADIMNDYSTEWNWKGMKKIIKDFREMLK